MNPQSENERAYYRHCRCAPYFDRIIVDHARQLIYCPVPKAACTSWKTALRWQARPDESHQLHGKKAGFLTLGSLSIADQHRVLSSYFKFTFVRHPLARLLSVYLDKFEKVHQKSASAPNSFWLGFASYIKSAVLDGGYAESSWHELTFGEFVRFVCQQRPEWMNEHWHPQVQLLAGLGYDYVGRFEDLAAGSDYVRFKTGLGCQLPSAQEAGIAKTSAGEQLVAYYTPELEAMARAKFAADFRAFDYQP